MSNWTGNIFQFSLLLLAVIGWAQIVKDVIRSKKMSKEEKKKLKQGYLKFFGLSVILCFLPVWILLYPFALIACLFY